MTCDFLNEVLSLNAQESQGWYSLHPHYSILNEVLSLNAQESTPHSNRRRHSNILNEVLSLNAQEFARAITASLNATSSMKS